MTLVRYFSGMTVWDGEGSGELSLPASGYIIENHRLLGGVVQGDFVDHLSVICSLSSFKSVLLIFGKVIRGVMVTLTNDEQIENRAF